jgi:hypothetical protein
MQAAHQEQQSFEEALKQVLAALSDKQEGEQTKGATVEQDANDVPNRAIRNSCAGPIDSLRKRRSLCSKLIHEWIFYLYTGIHFLLNASHWDPKNSH